MATRSSAFVQSSSEWTLQFDLVASPPPGVPEPISLRGRVRAGLATSIGVVFAAGVISAVTWSDPLKAAASVQSKPVGRPGVAAPATPEAAVVMPPSLYAQAAATCPGLPSAVLAAIHHVESRSGAQAGTSSAGARGPMQFMPETWRAYGIDGDGDGHANIEDPEDSVFSAAHYLCANGGAEPHALATALWNYNHSWVYVADVLHVAGSRTSEGE